MDITRNEKMKCLMELNRMMTPITLLDEQQHDLQVFPLETASQGTPLLLQTQTQTQEIAEGTVADLELVATVIRQMLNAGLDTSLIDKVIVNQGESVWVIWNQDHIIDIRPCTHDRLK